MPNFFVDWQRHITNKYSFCTMKAATCKVLGLFVCLLVFFLRRVTVFPRISAHALKSALPRISTHPLSYNIKQSPPLEQAPPPPSPLLTFLNSTGYKDHLFLLPLYLIDQEECDNLHITDEDDIEDMME